MTLKYDKSQIVFVDTETTGLYPELGHEVWEIALIWWDSGLNSWQEYTWQIRPNLSLADPIALMINKFYERTESPKQTWSIEGSTAKRVAQILSGKHLVGAIPSFDEKFLDKFLRSYNQCLTTHYHIVDVEAMTLGWLAGASLGTELVSEFTIPWTGKQLFEVLGLPPMNEEEKHTALGDARRAKLVWDTIIGEQVTLNADF